MLIQSALAYLVNRTQQPFVCCPGEAVRGSESSENVRPEQTLQVSNVGLAPGEPAGLLTDVLLLLGLYVLYPRLVFTLRLAFLHVSSLLFKRRHTKVFLEPGGPFRSFCIFLSVAELFYSFFKRARLRSAVLTSLFQVRDRRYPGCCQHFLLLLDDQRA